MALISLRHRRMRSSVPVMYPRKQSSSVIEPPFVLIVDDDPHIRSLVAELLESEQFLVETAKDGIEALAVMQRRRPAVILLDVMMPRMDGPTFVHTLRASLNGAAATPVLLMSAAPELPETAAALDTDYIPKPFPSLDLVIEKVRGQLGASLAHCSA